MADAHIDRIDTLEAQERFGALRRLVRLVRVVGLDSEDWQAMLDGLAEAGVPAANSRLPEAPNLILTERNPKLVDDRVVDVTLIYEETLNEGQIISPATAAGLLIGEISATIQQTTSIRDIDGNQVYLYHTYPEEDDRHSEGVLKRAVDFQYFQPVLSAKYQGIKTTDRPWLIGRSIVGAINRFSWGGAGEREWMCVSCSWRLYDAKTPTRYLMTWEFQNNPDTWDPTVVFIDDRTGKPATDLSADEIIADGVTVEHSIKKVRKHPLVDFEFIIGMRVQGG